MPIAGSMVIADYSSAPAPAAIPSEPEPTPQITPPQRKPGLVELAKRDGDKVWCEQCEMRVTTSQAVGCKSPHCKAKAAA